MRSGPRFELATGGRLAELGGRRRDPQRRAANTKAPRIQAILREVRRARGRIQPESLAPALRRRARAYLMSLPGIGPKTAAVVLSFALGRDAMPVDTHVHRVTKRLGIIPSTASAESADRLLHDLIPDGLRTPLHVAFIRLGRQICKAPTPRCAACPLKDLCPTAPRYLPTRAPRRGDPHTGSPSTACIHRCASTTRIRFVSSV